MNAPARAKTYNLPLCAKLLDWLEASPQKIAATPLEFAEFARLNSVTPLLVSLVWIVSSV